MSSTSAVRTATLRSALEGDLAALNTAGGWPHECLQEVADGTHLTVTAQAVIRVLNQLLQGHSPQDVQRWASFVRHGYFDNARPGPITPIDIELESAFESDIVDAVGRMDELGDLVDGELGADEIANLVHRLQPEDVRS